MPSPQQVAMLRTFIDRRTYAAAGEFIRLPGVPVPQPGSGPARAREVNGAFFSLVHHLSLALCAQLRAEPVGPGAGVLWDALCCAARPWCEEPDFPADLRDVVAGVGR